jgi:hypothetical protein
MLSKIKALPKLVAALAVGLALTFGAAEALADDPPNCSAPITACNHKADPYYYCNNVFCPAYYQNGGVCNSFDDCCLCLE